MRHLHGCRIKGVVGADYKGNFFIIFQVINTGTIAQCCFIMHIVDTVLYVEYCIMLSSVEAQNFEIRRAQPFEPCYSLVVAFVNRKFDKDYFLLDLRDSCHFW